MRRVALFLSVLLLAGLAPLSLGSGQAPPAGVASVSAGGVGVFHWTGAVDAPDATLASDGTGTLWFAMQRLPPEPASGNATDPNATAPGATQRAVVNLTSDDLAFAAPQVVLSLQTLASQDWALGNATFTTNLTEAGAATYGFTVEVYRESADGNVTLLGTAAGTGTVEVQAVVVDQPPVGLPMPVLVGGGAVLVVGGAAALYALRQRRERRLMNQAPRRSQVMRELELEKELEKVEEKEPERAAEIKQEIRAQEVVREKRRELQILEAKRNDVLKTMDLLKKRHESGGLTKHQYDNMVAKKQQDLTRIDAEIAQMEAEDAASGGAAA